MKILVGGECFFMQETGGISRIFHELIPRLRLYEHIDSIDVYLSAPLPASQGIDGLFLKQYGCWFHEAKRPFRLRKWVNQRLLTKLNAALYDKHKPDLYLSTYYSSPPKGVKNAVLVYDMIYERYPDYFDDDEREMVLRHKRQSFSRADMLICISEQTKRDLVSFYDVSEDRCRVCYLGGGEFSLDRRLSLAHGATNHTSEIHLLFVGGWKTTYKNFDFLLQSVACLSKNTGARCVVHVVSRQSPRSEDRLFHHNLFSGKIVYHDRASDAELLQLYCQSDVFVYPSLWEGFGIPVIEALSFGLPVACSDILVFHEVGGDVVEYFAPQDVEACAAAIARAVESRDVPEKIEARIQRAGMFAWDKCAEAFAGVIKEVGGRNSEDRGRRSEDG